MRAILFAAVIFTVSITVVAQTNKGGISGTVVDPNGAAVPGATVTITNVGTNKAVTHTTSSSGVYSATALDPVVYNVLVEAPGFKKKLVQNIKVDTATTVTVDVALEAGDISEQINVVAEAAIINTESGTPGQTVTERQIVEIPLNNRSVLDLVMTTPGVTGVAGTEDPELSSGEIPAPGFNVNVNGGRSGTTAILADGANNTGVGLGRAVVTFSPDTVQEFTVQRSNFSAEFGSTGGGVVNLSTKSGKNNFEGLFYWYHRNPKLNAAPYTILTTNRPASKRRQHQFGLIHSGPIWIPKIYDGRNKTFYFFSFEPRYYYDESPFTALLPTEAMLRGDFSNVVGVTGGYAPRDVVTRLAAQPGGAALLTQIRDATIYNHFVVSGNQFRLRTNADGTLVNNFVPFPFTNNVIPPSMLDPTAQELVKFLPKAGDYFLANGNLVNYASANFIKNLEKRMTLRIDHQISKTNRLTGRYTQVPIRGDRGYGDFEVGKNEVNSLGTDYSWSKQMLISDTQTFGSSVVNELRLNYTYGRFTRNLPPEFDAQSGRNFSTEIGLPSITHGGLPDIDIDGGGTIPNIGFSQSQQNENAEHSYEISNNLSWVHGNQTWKMGVSLMDQRLKTIPMFGASGGRWESGRNRTLSNSNGATSGTGGIELAQFLLGTYNQTTLREVLIPYYYQWKSAALYFQDDWKVKPNLTLNLGVRYSLQLPRTEKYNRQGQFMPELAKEFPLPSPVTLVDGRVITTALVPPFAFSGLGGRSRYLFPVEKMNFEPRFGFAWTPHLFGWNKEDKLIVRGGYGISHVPLTGLNRNPSPDFAAGTLTFGLTDLRNQFVDVSGRTSAGAAPTINILAARLCCNVPVLRPQSPEQFLRIPDDGLVYLPSINYVGAATAISPNTRIPYVQNWSLSFAYELPRHTVLELAYTGAKGTALFLPPININQVPFSFSQTYLTLGRNELTNINDPLGRRNAAGNIVQFPEIYLGTKYLGFSGFVSALDSSANSIYNAASVSLQRRYARGLSYTVNYTFGKSIDEASDAGDVRFVNLNVRSPGHVNFGAPRSVDRSVSLFDIRHSFSSTFVYDLPFGKRQRFFSNAPWLVQHLIGNWTLSGSGRLQSGLPYVVVLRDDNGLGVPGNVRAIRPDIVPGVSLFNPRYNKNCPIGQGCEPYFNPAAFMRPIKGQLGNAPRTFDGARMPWQQFLDLSLQKNFSISKDGKRRLQFRVDAINVLNHPFFRNGRLEDAGEIFAAPSETGLTQTDINTWNAFAPGRSATLAQVNSILLANRLPGSTLTCGVPPSTNTACALRLDFFHLPVPEGFFSMNANSFDITTLQGLQLYRLRQAYTPDRGGFLDVTTGRSGYTPRFIQFAIKLYF